MNHQLISSSAHQLISFQIGLLIMLFSLGCNTPISIGQPTATANNRTKHTSWDAGIVLSDRPGYACLSWEQAGLSAGDEIASLSTSCECISPKVIHYRTAESTTANAILLEYVIDHSIDPTQDTKSPAAHLGVVIAAKLSDGRQHEFTINLLHTHASVEDLP